jgi:integrase
MLDAPTRWALAVHLLPFFAGHLSEITVREVDHYKGQKLTERELVSKQCISPNSLNKTLKVLAQVLDAAVEYELLEMNPARGKRRRVKATRPRRTWLELDEVRALLDEAGDNRPLVAVMALAGLRVSEAIGLRWRDVDLARGQLRVRQSKTDAGVREVDVSPDLLDELKQAVAKANARLADADQPPMQDGVTNHTLRRTFASLLYEAGASPAYVMSQMGHTSPALALEVYAKKMERQRNTGVRMDALLKGVDWALMGTNPEERGVRLSPGNRKPRSGAFVDRDGEI